MANFWTSSLNGKVIQCTATLTRFTWRDSGVVRFRNDSDEPVFVSLKDRCDLYPTKWVPILPHTTFFMARGYEEQFVLLKNGSIEVSDGNVVVKSSEMEIDADVEVERIPDIEIYNGGKETLAD